MQIGYYCSNIVFSIRVQYEFIPTEATINDYSYLVGDKIGYGCSCEVFAGVNSKTGEEVAVKVVPKTIGDKEEHVAMAHCEIKHLQRLKQSPNVVQLRHVIQTKSSIYILTQLCQKGSLYKLIQSQGPLGETKAVKYIKDVILAVSRIAQLGIVHRDIKSINLLIDSTDNIKLCDFGFAIALQECRDRTEESVGSPLYMSPETLAFNQYGVESDIWAVGLVFLEMLLGKLPWKSTTEVQLLRQMCQTDISQFLPSGISKQARQFIEKCMEKDPSKRMKINELYCYWTQQRVESTQKTFSIITVQHKRKLSRYYTSDHNQKQASQSNLENTKVSQSNLESTKDSRTEQSSTVASQNQCKFSLQNQSLNSKFQNRIKMEKVSQFQNTESDYQDEELLPLRRKEGQLTKNDVRQESDRSGRYLIRVSKKNTTEEKILESKKKGERLNSSAVCIAKKLITQQSSILHPVQRLKQSMLLNKLQKQDIMRQLRRSIEDMRLLFKAFQQIHNYLRTKDSRFMELKQYLLFSVFEQINNILNLKTVNGVIKSSLKPFMNQQEYKQIVKIVEEHKSTYNTIAQQCQIRPKQMKNSQFSSVLEYATTLIYETVLQFQSQPQQFYQQRALVIVFAHLLNLPQLTKQPSAVSGSMSQLNEPQSKKINQDYWLQLKKKYQSGRK